MGELRIELGEIADIGCEECGGNHKSACGFIYKNDDAYGVYFATLYVGHATPHVGLTLSLGEWWHDEAVGSRSWVFLSIWPEANEYRMGLKDPKLSRHHNYTDLGKPLDRETALASPLRTDFFDAADCVIAHDPAVTSYLDTGIIDLQRWQKAQQEQSKT